MSNNRGFGWDRKAWGGQTRGGYGRQGNRGQGYIGFPHRGRNSGPYGGYRDDRNFGGRNNFGQLWKNRPKRDMPTKRLTEEEIAVTEYISDHEGFNGIIKLRYSDFQVSEINEKGEIAKLTDLSVPEPPVDKAVDEDEDLLFSKYNLEILPMETWDSINKLAICKEPTAERVEIDVSGMTKEQRTKIHDAVKKAFGDSIVGSTVNVDDKKLVRFEKYRKGVRIDNRVKWMWPGEYLHFIVHKENCDTMDAAVRIAERLRLNLKPSMLGYAGTKDRRAKTSQWFSLRKVDPRRVADSCRDMRDIHIGNYSFSDTHLKLGMLKGNMFRIALRNVTADDETIDRACSLLQQRGFVNYYGLQRFGTRRDTPTYVVGRTLLQGNFREAIKLILEEREGDLRPALRAFAAQGPVAAARLLPRRDLSVEARLLRSLARNPNDLFGALNTVSRNTRLLYVHAYQSLVWNRAASRRLAALGLVPAVGDLVPLASVPHTDDNDEESDVEDDTNETEPETQTETEPETQTETEPDQTNSDNTTDKSKDKKDTKAPVKIPVKVLTQEDVDSGKYSIFDIVLPLPGYNIEYPPNMKDYYEELLTADELKMDLRHKIKSICMSGAYRHVAVVPQQVRWRSVRYSDPYADLLQSDLDAIHNREPSGIVPDGKYKALLLTMSLPPSCYATMALRELLRTDTSCDNQAAQNNYHKNKPDDKDRKCKTEDEDEGCKSEKEDCEKNGVDKRKIECDEDVDVKKVKKDDE